MEYEIEMMDASTVPLVVVTVSRKAEPDPILAMLDELNAIPTSGSPLRILIDESKLDPVLLGPTDIRRFGEKWGASATLHEARVAIFAPAPVMYGLNRMFQLIRDTERLAVFRDREKAMRWLRAWT